MEAIVMFAVYALIGVIIVRFGIDSSRNAQHTKEILEELREIKELLKESGNPKN